MRVHALTGRRRAPRARATSYPGGPSRRPTPLPPPRSRKPPPSLQVACPVRPSSPSPPPNPWPRSTPTGPGPRQAAARDTVARRTGRSLRKLASSASQEVAEETRLGRELQQPVTTGRVVAVTSIRGGVGKTTTSALSPVTSTLPPRSGLALEADAALGTLRCGWARRRCAGRAPSSPGSSRRRCNHRYHRIFGAISGGGWLLPASQGRIGAPWTCPPSAR